MLACPINPIQFPYGEFAACQRLSIKQKCFQSNKVIIVAKIVDYLKRVTNKNKNKNIFTSCNQRLAGYTTEY